MSGGAGNLPRVRAATTNDLPGLVRRVGDYWSFEGLEGFNPAGIRTQLRRLLSAPHLGSIRVAGEPTDLAGYVIVVFVFSLEHSGLTAEIDELYVTPQWRRRGLASELLAAAERLSRQAGCTGMFLQIGQANEVAHELYAGRGFVPRQGFEMLEKPLG